MNLESRLLRRWYGRPGPLQFLSPLEWLYRAFVALRRLAYARGWKSVWRAPVPVIVVGNISVGGTGKTPVVIALCEALRRAGHRPGIVSRGYGAKPPVLPFDVLPGGEVAHCGDEPLLLARRSGAPVVIAPRRADAARHLLERHDCDVIVCDDGLQHYALARDIECVVVDGERGFGNGHCLPVGPLREPLARLRGVDAVLVNGGEAMETPPRYAFALRPQALLPVAGGAGAPVAAWLPARRRVHAVAGIGNPQRFFTTLRRLGFEPVEHAFPDHHVFSAADFQFSEALPVVMTEKDAVKCSAFADDRLWYLPVAAALPDSLTHAIIGKISTLNS